MASQQNGTRGRTQLENQGSNDRSQGQPRTENTQHQPQTESGDQQSQRSSSGSETQSAIDTIVRAIMPTLAQTIDQQVTAALQRQMPDKDVQGTIL